MAPLRCPPRWNVLAVCVLFQGYTIGLIVYSFTLWVRPFMLEFGSARAPIVALAGFAGLAMAIAAPLAGWASDRIPIRYVAGNGLLLFAVGLLLLSRSSSVWQLGLIYATLLPLGAVLAGPVVAQIAVTRSFDTHRGFALGISWAGTALGGMVLPPVIESLIESGGWRLTHLILAGAGLTLTVPVFMVLGKVRRGGYGATGDARDGPQPSFAAVLRDTRFWLILLSVVPISIVFASVQFNLGPLASDFGFVPRTTGYALSLLSATMIAAKLGFGTLADRIDHRLLLWTSIAAMVTATLLLSVGTVSGFVVGVAFLGVAGGGFLPLVGVMVAERFRSAEFGRAIGLCFFALNATYVGPWIAARMRDLTGSYLLALHLTLGVLLPAAIAIGFLGRLRAIGARPA